MPRKVKYYLRNIAADRPGNENFDESKVFKNTIKRLSLNSYVLFYCTFKKRNK